MTHGTTSRVSEAVCVRFTEVVPFRRPLDSDDVAELLECRSDGVRDSDLLDYAVEEVAKKLPPTLR